MKQKAFSLLAALLIGAATLPAAAQEQLIYWCKDASGRTSLQDKPCPGMVVVPAKAEQPQQQEDAQKHDGGTFSVLPAARQSAPALASAPTTAAPDTRVIHTGPGGGKYYINASGNKVYVSSSGAAASSSRPRSAYSGPSSAAGRSLYTGPRGGQYYINSNGKKVYVRKK